MSTPAPKKPPIKKPPLLVKQTQQIIRKIETKLGSAFLTYWNSTNGSVCSNDVIGLYEVLQTLGSKDKIVLFIKSGGGNGKAALRMTHLLREYVKKLEAMVVLDCASAATMIALGADEVFMGPLAYFTAVDTSITHDLSPVDKNNYLVGVSQDELRRTVGLWQKENEGEKHNPYSALFPHIHPLVIGAVDRASSLSTKLCEEILSYHMSDKDKIHEISRILNSEYPSHSYPITLREAKKIGLNAKPLDPEINNLLLELNELYSEMGQKAITDFDDENHHDNEILNIIEGNGIQIFYQTDKDWHYRKEERRWVSTNDQSRWHKLIKTGTKFVESVFHMR
jgi:Serine dehydrogenase proteinase